MGSMRSSQQHDIEEFLARIERRADDPAIVAIAELANLVSRVVGNQDRSTESFGQMIRNVEGLLATVRELQDSINKFTGTINALTEHVGAQTSDIDALRARVTVLEERRARLTLLETHPKE